MLWHRFFRFESDKNKEIMRTFIISLLLICSLSVPAQSRKDTVKLDSTQVEKIKKMPMDTVGHKMPVMPVTPPPKLKETGYLRKVGAQKKQPV